MAIAGFKRLGEKLRVGFCSSALVFDESFRHLKTTVTDWHVLFSNIDFRLTIGNRLRPEQSKFENLKSKFLPSPGFPWRVRLPVKRRRPRDQRRNFKNSLRNEKSTPQIEFCKRAFSVGRDSVGPTNSKIYGPADLVLPFHNLIRQLVTPGRSLGEM